MLKKVKIKIKINEKNSHLTRWEQRKSAKHHCGYTSAIRGK